MLTMIRVQPARERRVDFAQWAVEQTPMVRTCSHIEYAVPPGLFTGMPEDLLVGSLVDGHRYRSPLEDELQEAERTAVPGESLPPVPDSAYPPGATPLDESGSSDEQEPAASSEGEDAAPLDDSGDDEETAASSQGEGFPCPVCERPFATARGRDTHSRKAHPEEAP